MPYNIAMETGKQNTQLTVSDLIVISLLLEKPMHGYDINKELHQREVEDWASISRAQVYYSLKKLYKLDYIQKQVDSLGTTEQRRQIYSPTEKGRQSFFKSLTEDHWCIERPVPRFLTWSALSANINLDSFRLQIKKRITFIKKNMEREKNSPLNQKKADSRVEWLERQCVQYITEMFETELKWLNRLLEPKEF